VKISVVMVTPECGLRLSGFADELTLTDW